MSSKMTIGKAAKRAGVGVETTRFYEREGLIERPPAPGGSGYRIYPDEVIDRIHFICQAKEAGFLLREVKALLALRDDPSADCADVRGRAHARHGEICRKITRLEEKKAMLEEVLGTCPGEGTVAACPIISAFESGEPPH